LGVYGEDSKDVTLLTTSLPATNGMQVAKPLLKSKLYHFKTKNANNKIKTNDKNHTLRKNLIS
jgi:hypothetical protein